MTTTEPVTEPTIEPTRAWVIANAVLMQVGWFACVLGAAHGWPAAGTLTVIAIVAWHLWRTPRPAVEVRLIAAAVALGIVFDGVMIASGSLVFPNGQFFAALTPHWMMALWAVFAVGLNVSLRWLKPRLWLAAVLGAIAGPVSFSGGVRLGGASFVDRPLALGLLAVGWLVVMPTLVWLGKRFDGVAGPVVSSRTTGVLHG